MGSELWKLWLTGQLRCLGSIDLSFGGSELSGIESDEGFRLAEPGCNYGFRGKGLGFRGLGFRMGRHDTRMGRDVEATCT